MSSIPVRRIKAAFKEPDLSGAFTIRDIEGMLGGKDMVQALHRHDFYYILILKKGRGTHAIDFAPYPVAGNTVFIMRPGQVHQLVLKAGSRGYLIQCKEAFFFPYGKGSGQLMRKVGTVNHYQLSAGGTRKLLTVLNSIFREFTGKQEMYEEVIKAHMGIFFIELARSYGKRASPNVNLYLQEQLETFLALVETSACDHKTVSQYAAMMGLSTYQLNAITKATLGKTCLELINEYMILEAKRWLLATGDQVNQIADHLGYEDISYFIRFFKKHTGYSPEAFRQKFR
jgi:AraC family transcriptional activator of pobA